MSIPTDRLYRRGVLNGMFALSATLMTASILWLVWVDYDRPWRHFQASYFVNKAALAHFSYLSVIDDAFIDRLQRAEQRLIDALALRETLRGSKRAQYTRERSTSVIALNLAERSMEHAQPRLRVLRESYQRALEQDGPDTPAAILAFRQLDRQEADIDDLQLAVERPRQEIARLDRLLRGIDAPVKSARRRLRRLQAERDEAWRNDRRYRGVLTDSGPLAGVPVVSTLINFPFLDFIASRDTPGGEKVRQFVLPEVKQPLHYKESYTIDRCNTCHIAIDDPAFARERLQATFEKARSTVNRASGQVKESTTPDPNFENNGFDTLFAGLNAYLESTDRKPMTLEQPLLAHPNLGLFVSPNSPHPAATMGCTACHDGNPQETDFVLATHSPGTHKKADDWEEKYYDRHWGIPAATFEQVSEAWDRPMLEPAHREAGCAKCHTQIADIGEFNGRHYGGRLNLGRHLFATIGCANCHPVDSLKDTRRIGPDLTHVASKLDPAFMRPWIFAPQRFNPMSRMPHFFSQENNSQSAASPIDPDPVLRTETEAAAMAQYLTVVSVDWQPLTPPEGVVGRPQWGQSLFKTLGCAACHTNAAEYGREWVQRHLMHDTGIDVQAAWKDAGAMTPYERVRYLQQHLPSERDVLADPTVAAYRPEDQYTPPIITRFAPELSGIGSKTTYAWLYSWLLGPTHYAPETKMPSLRLTPIEAADLAAYLMKQTNDALDGFDIPLDTRHRAMGDELLTGILGEQRSQGHTARLIADEDGELTNLFSSLLDRSPDREAAGSRFASLTLADRRLTVLGRKMISRYGCYACHDIPGFEDAIPPGTNLTAWAAKPVARLDFGYWRAGRNAFRTKHEDLFTHVYPPDEAALIDLVPEGNQREQILPTRAAFAAHKVRNPRIWDRGRIRDPRDKLKMPNFYLSEREADALTTFLLSLRPGNVTGSLLVDYDQTPAGRIAAGRHLARELNCIGCHAIDGNTPILDQYYRYIVGDGINFEARLAPPTLAYEGGRVQSSWVKSFVRQVEEIRPWLQVRMPSFNLTPDQADTIAQYFVGNAQHEGMWLAKQLAPIEAYLERHGRSTEREGEGVRGSSDRQARRPGWDWYREESLAPFVKALSDYGLAERFVQREALDPSKADPRRLAATYDTLLDLAQTRRQLYDIVYPIAEPIPPSVSEDWIADGRLIFSTLNCFGCHIIGDRTAPGAVVNRLAPDLQPVHRRLRRAWVHHWLDQPTRILPSTLMVNIFPEDRSGALARFSLDDRRRVAEHLNDIHALDNQRRQIEAVTEFIFDAGQRKLTLVREDLKEDQSEPRP